MNEAKYIVLGTKEWVEDHSNPLVLRDMGPHDEYKTITNAAEEVIIELKENGLLSEGRRVFYYDSAGQRDELLHKNGEFYNFAFGNDMEDFPQITE